MFDYYFQNYFIWELHGNLVVFVLQQFINKYWFYFVILNKPYVYEKGSLFNISCDLVFYSIMLPIHCEYNINWIVYLANHCIKYLFLGSSRASEFSPFRFVSVLVAYP